MKQNKTVVFLVAAVALLVLPMVLQGFGNAWVRIADMAAQMIELSGRGDDGIAIEYVGLRPGEKLYEELAHDGEALRPSGIDGINMVAPQSLEAPTILPWVRRLELAAEARDVATIRQLLALGTGYRQGTAPVVDDERDDEQDDDVMQGEVG